MKENNESVIFVWTDLGMVTRGILFPWAAVGTCIDLVACNSPSSFPCSSVGQKSHLGPPGAESSYGQGHVPSGRSREERSSRLPSSGHCPGPGSFFSYSSASSPAHRASVVTKACKGVPSR